MHVWKSKSCELWALRAQKRTEAEGEEREREFFALETLARGGGGNAYGLEFLFPTFPRQKLFLKDTLHGVMANFVSI